MNSEYLNFDGEPEKLVDDARMFAEGQQRERNNQYSRDHKNINGYIDTTKVNPDHVHIFIPKLFNIVKTKTSRNLKGTIGTQPYIPFEATRPDLRGQSVLLERMLNHYLCKADFEEYYEQSARIKTTYGTSFIECIPYYDKVTEKAIIVDQWTGQKRLQEHQVYRLQFKLRTFAPWEVLVDPYTRNLNSRTGCRYVIKIELVSKRQLMELAEKGAYPGIDMEKLLAIKNDGGGTVGHWGLRMLSEMGLSSPATDNDMGVLLRYESPDRYIDYWNGTTILRNIPNPFKHKLINLSVHQHLLDAHTQNSFWGIGECKPNEVLQAMLNDTWNQTFNNHQMHNQNTIYYRTNAVNPDALVRVPGNRVGINQTNDRPISDSVVDAPLHSLPREHYLLGGILTNTIDMTSDVYDATRGQESHKQATASEYAMRQAAGDVALEREIRQSERFLGDFGSKCLSHMTQFGTVEDKVNILGQEGAMELMYSTPNDLPGGWDFTFRGSAKIADQYIQQRNAIQLMPIIQNNPASKPAATLQWVYGLFNIPPQQAREMSLTDEELMQMRSQQAQQEFEKEIALAKFQHQGKMQMEQYKGEIKKSSEGDNTQQAQGAKKTQVSDGQNTAQKHAETQGGSQ